MSLRLPLAAAAVALSAALISALPTDVRGAPAPAAPAAPAADTARRDVASLRRGLGLSGALRVAVVRALDPVELPLLAHGASADPVRYRWAPLFGTPGEASLGDRIFTSGLEAPTRHGVWRLVVDGGAGGEALGHVALITKVPFASKQGRYLNGYHIGIYPTEGSGRSDRYAPPEGFIEVTAENQDLHVSEHFRLRSFLTKDQHGVWPKYVALDMRLIDKLELVLQELNAMGVRAERMHVMSGYRTPQYNGPGGDGRAQLSRHTYGDAADVWVDNEGDGYVSDLNGDGRRDVHDVEVMLRAVERVEQRYPELTGGAGVYNANGSRSPFIHIDVRGSRSRW